VIVYPSRKHGPEFKAENNVIVGNTCLYGATSGKVIIIIGGVGVGKWALKFIG